MSFAYEGMRRELPFVLVSTEKFNWFHTYLTCLKKCTGSVHIVGGAAEVKCAGRQDGAGYHSREHYVLSCAEECDVFRFSKSVEEELRSHNILMGCCVLEVCALHTGAGCSVIESTALSLSMANF